MGYCPRAEKSGGGDVILPHDSVKLLIERGALSYKLLSSNIFSHQDYVDLWLW